MTNKAVKQSRDYFRHHIAHVAHYHQQAFILQCKIDKHLIQSLILHYNVGTLTLLGAAPSGSSRTATTPCSLSTELCGRGQTEYDVHNCHFFHQVVYIKINIQHFLLQVLLLMESKVIKAAGKVLHNYDKGALIISPVQIIKHIHV